MPAGANPAFSAPVISSSEAARVAAEANAARDAWLWSQQGASVPPDEDEGEGTADKEAGDIDWGEDGAGDRMLGVDLEGLSAEIVKRSTAPSSTTGGGGGGGLSGKGIKTISSLPAVRESLKRWAALGAMGTGIWVGFLNSGDFELINVVVELKGDSDVTHETCRT